MSISSRISHHLGASLLAGALLVAPLAARAQGYPAQAQDYPTQNYPAQGQGYPTQDPGYAGQDYPAEGYPDQGNPQGPAVEAAPPAIPAYAQPECPGDGYIWTPGYWAYGAEGYYWVNGAWVLPPYTNALWTPGYWGLYNSAYYWNAGYWGPSIGYYGGINYGFGYFGTGFYGGYWGGGHFFYNQACTNHLGYGYRNIYNRPWGGVYVHPGGSSYARVNYRGGFRGSNIGRPRLWRSRLRRGLQRWTRWQHLRRNNAHRLRRQQCRAQASRGGKRLRWQPWQLQRRQQLQRQPRRRLHRQ